ncbi:hypothetical protein DFH09DRAFT_1099133 [Mycena vulgaris]|nr:hypothetical protein DFH09DRAFT_1099133 [Mycena vulgaris]
MSSGGVEPPTLPTSHGHRALGGSKFGTQRRPPLSHYHFELELRMRMPYGHLLLEALHELRLALRAPHLSVHIHIHRGRVRSCRRGTGLRMGGQGRRVMREDAVRRGRRDIRLCALRVRRRRSWRRRDHRRRIRQYGRGLEARQRDEVLRKARAERGDGVQGGGAADVHERGEVVEVGVRGGGGGGIEVRGADEAGGPMEPAWASVLRFVEARSGVANGGRRGVRSELGSDEAEAKHKVSEVGIRIIRIRRTQICRTALRQVRLRRLPRSSSRAGHRPARAGTAWPSPSASPRSAPLRAPRHLQQGSGVDAGDGVRCGGRGGGHGVLEERWERVLWGQRLE